MSEPRDPTSCPLCEKGGFEGKGATINHVLNKKDEDHQEADGYDLNSIGQVRDWFLRKGGEEGGDPVLDGGPPEVPEREEEPPDRPIPGDPEIECPECGAGAGIVQDAPDGIPETWMCTRCSRRGPGDRVYCFSREDL